MSELRLRLSVMRHRAQLDAALADGADPSASPALALRAQQLTTVSTRRALATTLHNLLDAAEGPAECWVYGSRPPLQRDAVLHARIGLLALAQQLRGSAVTSPRAAALAALLVWDSGSPMYSAISEASVAQWVSATLHHLVV